jgi:hypothetical protein
MVFLLGAGSDWGLFDSPKFSQFHGFPFDLQASDNKNLKKIVCYLGLRFSSVYFASINLFSYAHFHKECS